MRLRCTCYLGATYVLHMADKHVVNTAELGAKDCFAHVCRHKFVTKTRKAEPHTSTVSLPPQVVFADADKALTAAIALKCPSSFHKYCVWHTSINVTKACSGMKKLGRYSSVLLGRGFLRDAAGQTSMGAAMRSSFLNAAPMHASLHYSRSVVWRVYCGVYM